MRAKRADIFCDDPLEISLKYISEFSLQSFEVFRNVLILSEI